MTFVCRHSGSESKACSHDTSLTVSPGVGCKVQVFVAEGVGLEDHESGCRAGVKWVGVDDNQGLKGRDYPLVQRRLRRRAVPL